MRCVIVEQVIIMICEQRKIILKPEQYNKNGNTNVYKTINTRRKPMKAEKTKNHNNQLHKHIKQGNSSKVPFNFKDFDYKIEPKINF